MPTKKPTESEPRPNAEDVKAIIRTIRDIAVEFKNVEARTLRRFIEIYAPMCGSKPTGNLYHLAMAYLICHQMKMSGMGDNRFGTVDEAMRYSSVSEGRVSVSFNSGMTSTADTDSEFTKTAYGTRYLSVIRRCVIPLRCGGMRA